MSGLRDTLLVLPVVVPLATAALCVVAGGRGAVQRALGIAGAFATLAAAGWLVGEVSTHGVLVTTLANWPAPFGIAFAADRLGALMALVAALGSVFGVGTLGETDRGRAFMPLLHLLLAGMGGFFLTADVFNLYVWFELILVASFGLMVLTGDLGAIEGATKYFAINIVGSMIFLAGVALLYALAGTLSLAELPARLDEAGRPHLRTAVAALMLVSLGIKSAAFPLFFWLPASYHTPPIGVTAIFGGVLTKVGVYGLLRLFTLLFDHDPSYTHNAILVLGALTMVTGVLGAVAQHDLRRLLSFHIISQIGYMLLALGFNTVAGVAASIFFVAHIVVTKTALFFVSGVIERAGGSFDLDRLGGLYARRPALAALFLVPALSLGGIPPLSGFVAKLGVVQAGLKAGRPLLVGVALFVSLLTLYSMAKIWTHAFWAPPPEDEPPPRATPAGPALWGPALLLAVLSAAAGVAAQPVLACCIAAAESLMDPAAYIDAILPEETP